MYVDQMMYWVWMNKKHGYSVEMASLNGTGRVTLLNEYDADYTGITLDKNVLYISDESRRLAFYMFIGVTKVVSPGSETDGVTVSPPQKKKRTSSQK